MEMHRIFAPQSLAPYKDRPVFHVSISMSPDMQLAEEIVGVVAIR